MFYAAKLQIILDITKYFYKKNEEKFIFLHFLLHSTPLLIKISLTRLFFGAGEGLVRDLDIVELAKERELWIDGAQDSAP